MNIKKYTVLSLVVALMLMLVMVPVQVSAATTTNVTLDISSLGADGGDPAYGWSWVEATDRKSTRLNSSHT